VLLSGVAATTGRVEAAMEKGRRMELEIAATSKEIFGGSTTKSRNCWIV
jgi:hypothetical protein